jgi:hypothetical protein
MMLAIEAHYVLPAWIPTGVVCLMAAAAIGVWVLAHRLTRGVGGFSRRALAFGGRVLVGFLAMLAVAQAFQRPLVLATNWPLWPVALLGALAVEIVLGLYRMERRTVSRTAGAVLATLRVLLVALVIVMLAQPVRPWTLDKTIQRYVAVLLDESASMYIPDTQLSAAEKIRIAEALSREGVRRPCDLDATAEEMEKVRGDLSAQGEWLASLGAAAQDDRRKQLDARREALAKALEAADKKLADLVSALAKPLALNLKPDDVVRLEEIRKRLTSPVRERLKEAVQLTSKDNAGNLEREHGRLLQAVRQAAADLADVVGKTAALGVALDEAAYAALPPEAQAKADAVALEKRVAVARDVLLHRPALEGAPGEKSEKAPSLLDQLQGRYAVKMYTFASTPTEIDVQQYAASYTGPMNPPQSAADLPPEQQQTDFGAALEKVATDMTDKQLSGILLLTDGRSNAGGSVEPLVKKLGVQQVPVSSVVFGGAKPPIDAGIVSVEAPEALAVRDRMLINAEVKLDGLAGREVRVTLADGDKAIDTQTVRVPSEAYRARVQLADEPGAAGLHRYRIEVQKFDGEVLAANNTYPIAVNVTDERTKLLIIEGRPRWEFRYLKNLFASRDRTVRLQYVLFEPDRIEGVPQPPVIEASVSRPIEEVEANALPKDEAEWMKFDVIVLGDVAPKSMRDEDWKAIHRFVTDRGGTLVVIAGPLYMPHAYVGTPFAEILPVLCKKEDQAVMTGPEKSFRIALTTEGRDSVIMREKMTPEENQEVWDSLPDLYWRHPILHAKEGATILAYALPPSPPDFLPRKGAPAETPTDAQMQQRRLFEQENALIAYNPVAMGQVMFLGSDHTWRLRYRVGDTYHHRFWGQVLRWATANKLPAGTETVKLGTDRSRYAPGAAVRVRAKIAKKDYTPILSDNVSVTVLAGDREVVRKKLQYIKDSPGMYAADLGALDGGNYRVRLDAPDAQGTLAESNASEVATEFSVEPSLPAEQGELSPDRGLLSRLASLTGGTVADPAHAGRILASLGKPTEVEIERHEYVLWDSWPLLLVMVLMATVEWILRKKVGLA